MKPSQKADQKPGKTTCLCWLAHVLTERPRSYWAPMFGFRSESMPMVFGGAPLADAAVDFVTLWENPMPRQNQLPLVESERGM